MFSYDFHENRKKNQAIYGPSRILKALCAFFLVPLAIGLFIAVDENALDAASAIPCIIMLLLLLTLLFRDSCIFDNEERRVTSVFGFGPFVRKEAFSYSEIERIEVTHFIKGIPEYSEKQKPSWRHKAQAVLAIRLKSDDKHILDIIGEKKSAGRIERNASWLAGFTGLALFVDRPRNTSL